MGHLKIRRRYKIKKKKIFKGQRAVHSFGKPNRLEAKISYKTCTVMKASVKLSLPSF